MISDLTTFYRRCAKLGVLPPFQKLLPYLDAHLVIGLMERLVAAGHATKSESMVGVKYTMQGRDPWPAYREALAKYRRRHPYWQPGDEVDAVSPYGFSLPPELLDLPPKPPSHGLTILLLQKSEAPNAATSEASIVQFPAVMRRKERGK